MPTDIAGAWVIVPEPVEDERGSFTRVFCRREFEAHGLNPDVVQCSVSFNRQAGTLRGLHFQAEPHGEEKVVRCIRGKAFDVIADLRQDSPTYRKWQGIDLDERSGTMVYIPRGVAHGFLTLADETEIFYFMSEFHVPELSRGVRWDDPSLNVCWPDAPRNVSSRDRDLPFLSALHT